MTPLSTRLANVAHKVIGGGLIAFTAFGIFNAGSMFHHIYRKAEKARAVKALESAETSPSYESPTQYMLPMATKAERTVSSRPPATLARNVSVSNPPQLDRRAVFAEALFAYIEQQKALERVERLRTLSEKINRQRDKIGRVAEKLQAAAKERDEKILKMRREMLDENLDPPRTLPSATENLKSQEVLKPPTKETSPTPPPGHDVSIDPSLDADTSDKISRANTTVSQNNRASVKSGRKSSSRPSPETPSPNQASIFSEETFKQFKERYQKAFVDGPRKQEMYRPNTSKNTSRLNKAHRMYSKTAKYKQLAQKQLSAMAEEVAKTDAIFPGSRRNSAFTGKQSGNVPSTGAPVEALLAPYAYNTTTDTVSSPLRQGSTIDLASNTLAQDREFSESVSESPIDQRPWGTESQLTLSVDNTYTRSDQADDRKLPQVSVTSSTAQSSNFEQLDERIWSGARRGSIMPHRLSLPNSSRPTSGHRGLGLIEEDEDVDDDKEGRSTPSSRQLSSAASISRSTLMSGETRLRSAGSRPKLGGDAGSALDVNHTRPDSVGSRISSAGPSPKSILKKPAMGDGIRWRDPLERSRSNNQFSSKRDFEGDNFGSVNGMFDETNHRSDDEESVGEDPLFLDEQEFTEQARTASVYDDQFPDVDIQVKNWEPLSLHDVAETRRTVYPNTASSHPDSNNLIHLPPYVRVWVPSK
ncbi:hypothetical protein HK102_007359 [Quaeritorhiza haematococci]|nr:hypothetical protein HK102_007359 [Quaeritorhiza haematococci]